MDIDIDYFSKLLTKIFTSSPPVFLCVALIMVGYAVKLVPGIPNRIIPITNFGLGMIVFPIISISDPGSLPQSHPQIAAIVRDIMGGIIIAAFAWIIHAVVLKRFIDKFMPVNENGDTKFTAKSAVETPEVKP